MNYTQAVRKAKWLFKDIANGNIKFVIPEEPSDIPNKEECLITAEVLADLQRLLDHLKYDERQG